MSASKHLLRWKGRQSGPFARDEIHARLKSSDIGMMHEVQVDGQWITVEKYLAQTAPRPITPPPKPEKPAPQLLKIEEPKPPPPPPPPLPPTVPISLPPAIETTLPPQPSLPPGTDAEPADFRFYAGFWLRAVAVAIDSVVVSALVWALAAIALVTSGAAWSPLPAWMEVLVFILYLLVSWLYGALAESSESQTTLGKLAVGLMVTNLTGNRLTFAHASLRHLGKMLSALAVGAGFFMAAFTEHKQALHDLLAGTHVLLRLPASRTFQP